MSLFDLIGEFFFWTSNFISFYLNIEILGIKFYNIILFIFITAVLINFFQKLLNSRSHKKGGVDK